MSEDIPLRVWFVNVGHGDCTIVKFPSRRVMMVDISNCGSVDEKSEGELMESAGLTPIARALLRHRGMPLPLSVSEQLRSYLDLLDDPIDDVIKTDPHLLGCNIFRFVLTHPDMDHMTGLYRLMQEEPSIDVLNFWDTANDKRQADKAGPGFDPRDWEEYQRVRQSDGPPQVLRLHAGAYGEFYTDDGIDLLSPTPTVVAECNAVEDWNNMSQVLRIRHGDSTLLLLGDAEASVQQALLNQFGSDLRSTVLKAPHHGRDSGYHCEFARAVSPEYTIVSVGKKPECDASNKYRQHTRKRVFSTRFMGTIYAELYPEGEVHIWNSPKKGRERIDEEAALAAAMARVAARRRAAMEH